MFLSQLYALKGYSLKRREKKIPDLLISARCRRCLRGSGEFGVSLGDLTKLLQREQDKATPPRAFSLTSNVSLASATTIFHDDDDDIDITSSNKFTVLLN